LDGELSHVGDEAAVEWRRDDAGNLQVKRDWNADAIDEVFRVAK
jgi:hypothetical protein